MNTYKKEREIVRKRDKEREREKEGGYKGREERGIEERDRVKEGEKTEIMNIIFSSSIFLFFHIYLNIFLLYFY